VEVRKEVIRTGKHVYLDELGRPAVLDTTPQDIDHYLKNGTAMLAAGIPIPVPLEHQPSATPMNAADRAANLVRNNAGETKRFETDVIKTKDGDVHRLMSVLDIKDTGIAEKVKNGSVRWVSPWISSFTDGTGKQWDKVVSHVALTTRPRIHSQHAFESVPMAISAALSLATPKISSGLSLTRAGRLKKDGLPKFPIAFSMMTGVSLSEKDLENMDSDEESSEEEMDAGEEGADAEGDPTATAMKKEGEEFDDMEGEEAGDVSFEELIPHLLEMHGIHCPAGGVGKEFLQSLVRGLLASAKKLSAKAEGETTLDDPNDPMKKGMGGAGKPPGPVQQESPPMYMSLTKAQVEAVTDPEKRAMLDAMFSMQTQTNALRKAKLEEGMQKRHQRLQKILRFLPKTTQDELLQQATSVQMSLSNDGVLKDPMDAELSRLESVLGNLPAMLKNRDIPLSVEKQPEDGRVTPERIKELVDHVMQPARN
jgi:hypothetical protein